MGIPFHRAPVTLVLRDRVTGAEVTLDTDEVWMEVKYDYDTNNVLDFTPDRMIGQTVTIIADFMNVQSRMHEPRKQVEQRRQITGGE